MGDVRVTLGADEALVLLEALGELDEARPLAGAERRAPWDLATEPERQPTATFAPDHADPLRRAEARRAERGGA